MILEERLVLGVYLVLQGMHVVVHVRGYCCFDRMCVPYVGMFLYMLCAPFSGV